MCSGRRNAAIAPYVFTAALYETLIIHGLFVAFVVLGVLLIYAGYWLAWRSVRNFWFRLLHLCSVGFVVLESWIGVICPLTTWEMQLRGRAGSETYSGSFIEHWLQTILYYDAPAWVFMIGYTLFGALVLASWFIVPPTKHH